MKYPRLLLYDVIKYFYSLLHNPYAKLRISPQSSLLKEGNVYGETPWSALYKISKAFGITSQDVIYDLGSGLGKVCFWFAHVIQCQVLGVENQENFVRFSVNIHRKLSSGFTLFCLQDFKDISLSEASCVYFYGSSYSRRVLKDVLQAFVSMAPGAIVISISFPLDSFPYGKKLFFTEKKCVVRFPWGRTIAYKNVRKHLDAY
nr:SAM-dependent methyltransferase [Candidatus Chlamydia sanziniae]